jgi:LmbE family N-acetylglucosaminyl deacetylase
LTDSVAVIVAHPDDEVLGCGGTIARFVREGKSVNVLIVADGESSRGMDPSGRRTTELVAARTEAAHAARGVLGYASVELLAFPDNRLDRLELLEIVKEVERFIEQHRPATVLTHHVGDVNVDHKLVHEAVITSCRPQSGHPVRELLFCEIASSTEWRPAESGGGFAPNCFVDISAELETKVAALRTYDREMRAYPHPRSYRAVEALAQWRGATVGVAAAEAFVLGRRIIARQ